MKDLITLISKNVEPGECYQFSPMLPVHDRYVKHLFVEDEELHLLELGENWQKVVREGGVYMRFVQDGKGDWIEINTSQEHEALLIKLITEHFKNAA